MTHRIYLRWPGQQVSDKTTTESAAVAQFAFDELIARKDLIGQSVDVAWTADGKQQNYYSFAQQAG